MIYATAYEGTNIISCLRSKYITSRQRYIIDVHEKRWYDYHERRCFYAQNKLLDLSFQFAVAIVNLVDDVTAPKSSYMTDQLARAGTSVGANIHEAQYAQSKKDFVARGIVNKKG